MLLYHQYYVDMLSNISVCQRQCQSIKHLLFECIYVKPLWEIVGEICDFGITFGKILGTEECHSQDPHIDFFLSLSTKTY